MARFLSFLLPPSFITAARDRLNVDTGFLPYWSVRTASLGGAAPSPRLDLAAIHTWYNVFGYRLSRLHSRTSGSLSVLCFGNFWEYIKCYRIKNLTQMLSFERNENLSFQELGSMILNFSNYISGLLEFTKHKN